MSYFIGQRIVDKKNYEIKGTIKYIGPVCISTNNEQYLGIEWDQEGRGKYDGSVINSDGKRIRYFTCKENFGSFLKPKLVFIGQSLITALCTRYSQTIADVSGGVADGVYIENDAGKTIDVKIYGGNKIMKYQNLKEIYVASTPGECVSHLGDEDLSKMTPNLERLDVHDNLFSQWLDFFKIGVALPHLNFLEIDYNLMMPVKPTDLIVGGFNNLTDLILSYTNTQWEDLIQLAPYLPKLRELYLVGNNLKELSQPLPENTFQELTLMDISHNEIYKWTDLILFNCLPQLNILLFGYNPLEDIQDELPVFPTVEIVNCHNTQISSWNTISELIRIFPKMRTLRLQDTPLTQSLGPDISRLELIARISTLTRFNGSDVRTKQRIDSERYYLQRCITDILKLNNFHDYSQWANSPDDFKQKILENYPRYNELVEQHGEPIPATAQTVVARDSTKIEVTFENHITSSGEPEIKKKILPLSMKVKNLKDLLKRLFKIDLNNQKLEFRNQDETQFSTLDDVERDLLYYCMTTDAIIKIEEYNPELEKKQKEMKMKELSDQVDQWVGETQA